MTSIGARIAAAALSLKPLGLHLLVSPPDKFVITDKPDEITETARLYSSIEQVEEFIADNRRTGAEQSSGASSTPPLTADNSRLLPGMRPVESIEAYGQRAVDVVLYARFFAGDVARTIEVPDGAMVDVDAEGRVLGVEVPGGTDWERALASLAMAGRLKVVAAATEGAGS